MRVPPQARLLPDGRRLHLQHGPIDLIVQAFGTPRAVRAAYEAATRRFAFVLDELCDELPRLRQAALPVAAAFDGPVAQIMQRAVAPFAADMFITPMAAVAGAVAEHVLAQMIAAAPLDRAFVNNGGDIALHVADATGFRIGMVDRPDRPNLFGHLAVTTGDAIRGIATSGWRGRSFSLGIADSVTVLAGSASAADAAATVIANAVDLPGHPAVRRVPAASLQSDSDLGDRHVTRGVGPLSGAEIGLALERGAACASRLIGRGLVTGAALRLHGATRTVGEVAASPDLRVPLSCAPPRREMAHA